ncbi:hypothetical protein JB92DRAFT_2909192 [Gautieria morchelliformis]|nr:hypothetical protein JB92DRAFT_2909192 [Gautieria morchelliformis]
MSVPRLFKRLSQKNLRKRTQSIDSKLLPDDQKPPSPPPLPPPKSSVEFSNGHKVTPSSTIIKAHIEPLLPQTGEVNGHNGDMATASPLPPLPPKGDNIEENDVLASAWAVAHTAPPLSKTDKVLRQIENQVSGAQAGRDNNATLINGVSVVLGATGALEAIEQGLNHFLEGSAILMKSLDEVAKLHPFVGVAVMAFKAVWTLEMKRRENDKRIIALHVEMKNMMTVLIQLKNVKDPAEVAHDGTSIQGRMQGLAQGTADDIKACANACETYSKKKLVVKVIKGPVWEGKLLDFVGRFTKRRSEFEFALAIHTARGVDAANQTLSDLDKTTQEMNAKVDAMMKIFERFVLPEQKEMALLIEKKGGAKACQESDKILQELSQAEKKKNEAAFDAGAVGSHGRLKTRPANDLDELKEDLHTDPDEAMEKNMTAFSRKFEIQKRQITEELSKVMRREGDRIISAITSGPHDKIIDPDVYRIWQEMNWRGSVKARHFVMTLRDYFHEKWSTQGHGNEKNSAQLPLITDTHGVDDDWALAHLNVIKLQPISEAFDDDASGFITVAEANTFTTSRPLGWSLPYWIAYWAVGWHQALTEYSVNIRDIVGKMFAVLPTIRPENRNAVNDYLLAVYEPVTTLIDSINYCPRSDALRARFKSYTDSEEERLRINLDEIDYDIDAMDTLALVTGPGRIERFALPLLYLLLKRHFEIFRISQTRITHPDELWDAADTIMWVISAVYERVNVLQSIFKQQKLDVNQQFKTFAHGLFEYCNEPSGLWAPESVRERDPPYYPYNDKLEEQNLKAEDICNYPLDQQGLDHAAYDPPSSEEVPGLAQPNFSLKAVLGPWNGNLYYTGQVTNSGMISFTLCPGNRDNEFQASGRSNGHDFKISGTCSPGETQSIIAVSLKRTFAARQGPQYWDGQFDSATDTMTGAVSFDEERMPTSLTFFLKRTSPDQLRFRPSPAAFEANKARALWTFALSAARGDVRRQSWSWSFFRERRDTRKRFIQLYIRDTGFGKPLDEAERAELSQILKGLTTADSNFYHSLALYQIRITPGHGRGCDGCGGNIGGSRIQCMVCQAKDTWNSIDLCDAPECVAAEVVRDDLKRPHLPTHDFIKVRRVVHLGQVGQLEQMAKSALERARQLIEEEERRCIGCDASLTQPCWYCVQCEDESFICNECDAKGLASFDKSDKYKGAHDYDTHDLVRCQELVADVDASIEEQLASLEAKFANHEKVMDERLVKLESKVDDRLSKVEKLLELMHKKLGIEAE